MIIDFTLPAELEAHDPPEARGLARDGVRLLVSRGSAGEVSHHVFRDLPGLLLPGDLLVVNDTGTLPAQVRAGRGLAVHFSTPLPDGAWLVELRAIKDKISRPNGPGFPAQVIDLPGGAALTLEGKVTGRLWRARLSVAVVPYLLRYGIPIRYSYVSRDWPLVGVPDGVLAQAGQRGDAQRQPAVHAAGGDRPGGPRGADRPAHPARRGVLAGGRRGSLPGAVRRPARDRPAGQPRAGSTAGGSSPRAPRWCARWRRRCSHDGSVAPSAGWTSHVVTPETGVRAVDGLLTGLHEPRSSHLRMLAAFAGPELLEPRATRRPSRPGTCGTSSGTCTCCCRDHGVPGRQRPRPGRAAAGSGAGRRWRWPRRRRPRAASVSPRRLS